MKAKITQKNPRVNITEDETSPWAKLMEAGQDGYVTYDDILEIFPKVEQNTKALELILIRLESMGIEYFEYEEKMSKRGEKPDIEPIEDEEEEEKKNNSSARKPGIDDLVELYFQEAARAPLLTREEEVHLAKQIEEGRAARQALLDNPPTEVQHKLHDATRQGWEAHRKLIISNTRLVISVAKRYIGRGVPFLDLIQEGNIGLMRAIKKFDYRRGYKFSTFATWWIRQAVSRAISYQGRTIRIPVHMGDRISRLYRTQQKLKQDLRRDPSEEELAQALNIPLLEVQNILRVSQRTISLDKPTQVDEEKNLGDYIPDEESVTPEENVSQSLLRSQLLDIMDSLPAREAHLLKLRYGLLDGQSRSLHEVGKSMGISRERVRQIESQALRRLRRGNSFSALREYLDITSTN